MLYGVSAASANAVLTIRSGLNWKQRSHKIENVRKTFRDAVRGLYSKGMDLKREPRRPNQ